MRSFFITANPYVYQSHAAAKDILQKVKAVGHKASLTFQEDCPDDNRRGWIVSVYKGEAFKGYASHA